LDEIYVYYTAHVSELIALKIVPRILSAVEILSNHPKSGQVEKLLKSRN